VAIVLWGLLVFECRQAREDDIGVRRLFGPVVGNEVIAGRADATDDKANRTWLLVGERALVSIDLDRASVRRHPLQTGDAACWGLARLADGSLWTLKGRNAVVRISETGQVLKEASLGAAHFGIFAEGDRLIVQPADFQPPAPLLFAARVDEATRVAWGDLRSRPFRLARASVAALNMLTCGVGRRGERPCWFPDEPAVALMNAEGRARRVALDGLDVVSPEVLLTSDNPARPVRDAYVDAGGTIWVLSSGRAPAGADDQPGGWILARYSDGGARIGVQRLKESARLILRADARRALLLTGGGMVAEVVP
jgi:hypothetical protein